MGMARSVHWHMQALYCLCVVHWTDWWQRATIYHTHSKRYAHTHTHRFYCFKKKSRKEGGKEARLEPVTLAGSQLLDQLHTQLQQHTMWCECDSLRISSLPFFYLSHTKVSQFCLFVSKQNTNNRSTCCQGVKSFKRPFVLLFKNYFVSHLSLQWHLVWR
jgi:hypothetical protein